MEEAEILVDQGLEQMDIYVTKEYKRFTLLHTILKTQDVELVNRLYYTLSTYQPDEEEDDTTLHES